MTAKVKAPPTRIAYSVDGAAAAYDVSRDTIMRAIKSGNLAAKKVGPVYNITATALQAWHAALPDA